MEGQSHWNGYFSCLTFKRELYHTAYSYSRVGKLVEVGNFVKAEAVTHYLEVESVTEVLNKV